MPGRRVAATFSVVSRQQEVLDDMARRRVDPTAGRDRLLGELRTSGFEGTAVEAVELLNRYRTMPGVGPLEIDPRRTLSRAETARMLDRSVQRIDQLRRAGRLRWAQRADGRVAIDRRSVEELLALPSNGRGRKLLHIQRG